MAGSADEFMFMVSGGAIPRPSASLRAPQSRLRHNGLLGAAS
jgi:hypothetical protein